MDFSVAILYMHISYQSLIVSLVPFFPHLPCPQDPFPRPRESVLYSQGILGFCLFICLFPDKCGKIRDLVFLRLFSILRPSLLVYFQMWEDMRPCLPVTWCLAGTSFLSLPSCTNTPI